MDEVNKIKKAFLDGKSKNAIAKKFNRSWETIHRMVSMKSEDFVNRGKRPNRQGKVITPSVINEIHNYLDEEIEKRVKKKQRYTARKIFHILKEKGAYQGSQRQLQETVRQLREERAQLNKKAYLPLYFELGSTLQIDHGEIDVIIDGTRQTAYLFVASVPGFVVRYCQAYPRKAQEAWGDFHERAFGFFGGVFPNIVYDNDSVLVKKIIGTERNQTQFSINMEEHYGFESRFCNPASGNEKGSVENGVGYCRRNYLPGCPAFPLWDEINKHLLDNCEIDILEKDHYKTHEPLVEIYERLKRALTPMTLRKTWSKRLTCRVDSYQQITIDSHHYSVPEKYVGAPVEVALSIFQVRIFKDDEVVEEHERKFDGSDSLILDHYLDQLYRKPFAFTDCKPVQTHTFDPSFLEVRRRLLEKHPKSYANREFVKILILGRRYPQNALIEAIDQGIKYGAIDHASIETIIRKPEVGSPISNSEILSGSLKPLNDHSWEFDLSSYEKLVREVAL